ncbi:MAG: tetratricopeptide repeat protein [Acidobacteriota bacterium]
MEAERWRRIDQVFQEALELGPRDQPGFLADRCAGDPELRREVDSLLEASRLSEGYMETPRHAIDPDLLRQELGDPWVGRRIGAYRIHSLLGHGGMSSVYLVERADSEYDGRAAVKIMRPLTEDGDFKRRFRRECQILARLDHPHIARLIDSGTAYGRLYLLLELVNGVPIDRFCDASRLSIRQRLEIFLEVCGAVGHAHQNMVIHRDLKPSNVLVTADGHPRLLDFGIAKLLSPEEDSPQPTRTAKRLMTLDFASPEQVLGGPITAASDVYSLGILLFQLLAGAPPYRLAGVSAVQVERTLRHGASRPSESAAASGESAARRRRLTSRALVRQLKGDLDIIVQKALRTDPKRRYRSVEQLCLDIRRFLDGHPIQAVKPRRLYRLSRFMRREKLAVSFMAVLLALAVSSSIFAWRIQSQKAQIRAEQQHAQAVSTFLVEVFDLASPSFHQGEPVTARQLLDNAYEQFQTRQDLHPNVQIALLEAIGDAYQRQGLLQPGLETMGRSVELARAHHGEDHPRTLELIRQWATLHELAGDLVEAEKLARLAVAGLEPHGGHRQELASALGRLASIVGRHGDIDDARSLLERAIALQRRALGDRHPDLAFSLHELGLLHFKVRQLDVSERLTREAFEIWRVVYGDKHPDVLASQKQLAYLLLEKGELQGAERLTRSVLAREMELYDRPHPGMGFTLARLAKVRWLLGDLKEAEALARAALSLRLETLGDSHPAVGVSRYKLAEILLAGGRKTEAETLFSQSLAALERKMPKAVILAHPLLGLGQIHRGRDPRAAEALVRRALEIRRATMPAGDPLVLEAALEHGSCLAALGDTAGAEVSFEAIARQLDALPETVHTRALAEELVRRRVEIGGPGPVDVPVATSTG